MRPLLAAGLLLLVLSGAAQAEQAAATKTKAPPAKQIFGAADSPAPLAARSIGGYSKGCLAGAVALPINGPDWQVMRLSRNRYWGHPLLVDYLQRLAGEAKGLDGWPGLLVGDMSQPRGGPMLTGHTSHQIGLDVDIWLLPMPNRILTQAEREEMSAITMLKDPFSVDPQRFGVLQMRLIRRAASYSNVERIFVHPAIKKALCGMAGKDRNWLRKVRPWWGHHYHFHVRLACPQGSPGCEGQKPVPGDDGCGADLDHWYKLLRKAEEEAAKRPKPGLKPPPAKPPLTLANLPKECRAVLSAGENAPLSPEGKVIRIRTAPLITKDAGEPVPPANPAALEAGMLQTPLPDRKPR